jgi:hypothetical protein
MKKPLAGLAGLTLVAAAAVAPAHAVDPAPSAEEVQPLLIGAQAPDATVLTLDGTAVELKDILAKQRSVLVFYRGGW